MPWIPRERCKVNCICSKLRRATTRESAQTSIAVINKREIVQIKKLIDKIDPNSYVTLHKVQEIVRKGYKGVKV